MQRQVSFRDFPRTSRLYLDYLYDFDKVGPFYGSPFRPYELLSSPSVCAAGITASYPLERRRIVAGILERQNRQLGAQDDVFANIRRLRQSNCCAIVTGQQVGLFGGPLFTVFKTLAAVRLAHELTARGVQVVPIFWINDIDHDFEEVNHCRLFNAQGDTAEIQYQVSPEYAGTAVGMIPLGPEIEKSIRSVEDAFPETEFKAGLIECLRDSYRPGLSYSEGFSRTLLKLFRGQGLILMDPLDKELQEQACPVYVQAVIESELFNGELSERSRELESAGYHAQIHVDPQSTLLFINQDGKRCAVQRVDGGFHLKGTDAGLSVPQMLSIAEKQCWRLTPNVALRPMVQDYLLPTAAYIAGPSEVAYFAQLAPVYARYRRAMPVIYPRPSFTLLSREMLQIAERYQMELVDFLGPESEVLDRAFKKRLPEKVSRALVAAERGVPAEFEALKGPLAELDPTLAEALDHISQKVQYQLEALRTKLVHAEVRGHQDMAREVRACLAVICPNQNLQEREISILSFMARFGPSLIERLYQETDLACPDHRLLIL